MEFSFTFESVIGGHHVYKLVWTPFIGEVLSLKVQLIECSTLREVHGEVWPMFLIVYPSTSE